MELDFNFKRFPVAIIGEMVNLFKIKTDLPIVKVTDTASLKEMIDYYIGLEDIGHPLVIEDISQIRNSSSILLKFLEECKLPIILLCKNDTFKPVIASRILVFVKEKSVVKSEFLTSQLTYQMLKGENLQDDDMINQPLLYKEYCPMLYRTNFDIKSKKLFPMIIKGDVSEIYSKN